MDGDSGPRVCSCTPGCARRQCSATVHFKRFGSDLAGPASDALVCDTTNFRFDFTGLPTFTGSPSTPGTTGATLAQFTTIRVDDSGPLSATVTWTAADGGTMRGQRVPTPGLITTTQLRRLPRMRW